MSHTEQILDRFTIQQGWDRDTQLDLALRYIDLQDSPEAFEDFLRGIAETDNSEDLDPALAMMCAHCGDAVTWDVTDSTWVGSDGEMACPLSVRPHGPAVTDDNFSEQD